MAKAIVIYDDLELAEGKQVAADRTVVLSLGNRSVELDLTERNYGLLASALSAYFEAGAKPGSSGTRQGTGSKRGRRPKSYYDALQAFAGHKGIELRVDASGKTVYPDGLRAEYEASLHS